MRLSEIETKRAQKLAELKALIDVRDQASREFTADEATRFDALEVEVTNLNAEYAREQKAENIRKQTALNSASKPTPQRKHRRPRSPKSFPTLMPLPDCFAARWKAQLPN